VTPHQAGVSNALAERSVDFLAGDLVRLAQGRAPEHILYPEVLS
jgi:phosphoglycerate dehydrogenase-like enzyme